MIAVALKWLAGKALGLSSAWKAGIAVAAIMACVGMAASFYRCQAQEAEAEVLLLTSALDSARMAIADRDAALAALEEQRAKEASALATQLKKDETRACRVQAIREETYHAKLDEDGPVAPVLLRTLDGLRSPSGAGE